MKRFTSSLDVNPAILGETLKFRSGKVAQNRFLKAALTERLSSFDPKTPTKHGLPSQELLNLYDKWGNGQFGVVLTGNFIVDPDENLKEKPRIPSIFGYYMTRFSGKVAIVTGSSNGIGRATAIILAQDGAKVTITGRNAQRLDETLQLIIDSGVKREMVNLVIGDVTTSEVQDKIINSTIRKFGQLDILVNNAGAAVNDPNGASGINQDIETYDRMFELNLRSVVELTKKAKDHLIKTKGEIVNVSSICSGAHGQPEASYYSMTKAALDSFTRNTAVELIAHGVRVNSVNPGVIVTGFHEAMGLSKSACDQFYQFFDEHRECVPTGELGKPEDVANLIAFLADRDASRFIIGQTIVVDGGSTLIMALGAHKIWDMLK